MKKIYFLVFIAPIAIIFIVSSLYVGRELENWMMERVQTELAREATTVASVFTVTPVDKKIETLDPFIDKLAANNPFRLTIIRDDGVVLADSWVATHDMQGVKNHATRPELLTATAKNVGTFIRHSATVNTDMFYYAIPFTMPDFTGFIRVAIPLDTTQIYLTRLQNILIGTGLAGIIALFIIIMLATRYIDRINNRHLLDLDKKIQSRTKDINLLQTFGQMLTGCETIEEISEAVLAAAPSIFGKTSGAISLNPPSLDHIEIVAKWGEDWHPKKNYLPNDCWAFRRGVYHLSEKDSLGFNCKHFTTDNSVLCVPFVAQGVALGAIHIMVEKENFTERLQEMALTMAEHLSLSMSNVNLRNSLKHQAVRDPLTNLYNRRYLDDALRRDILRTQRREASLGVLMIDVDHFKQFNDTYGHEAGDYVLQKIGVELSNSIRSEDIACRYGGEEFTVIIPEADIASIARRAAEILVRVRALDLQFRNKTLGHLTLSIGVAISPHHGTDNQTLISAADEALYIAKEEGRDQVRVAALPDDLKAEFTRNLHAPGKATE